VSADRLAARGFGDAPGLPVPCGHIHQGSRTRIRAYRL